MADQVKELVEELRAAREAYYNTNKPIMSDAAYDDKERLLRSLDPDNSFFQTVGTPPPRASHLQKVKHTIPMGSLSNCTRDGDKANPSFDEWHEKTGRGEVCVMHKLDGSSIELIYEKGKLVQAITRGDGITGEDVTQNARRFKGVPQETNNKLFTGSVRGEAMLFLDSFGKYFQDQANPRNAANGTVRRSDGDRAHRITFVPFDCLVEQGAGLPITTHNQRLSFMETLGFDPVWRLVFDQGDTAKVLEVHEREANTRDSLPYEIDGLVVRLNKDADFDMLGERDNRPKGAVAFKFKASEATTELLDVKVSIGHTGAIIPTADLAPVEIGGVTVRSALLNNYEEIERLRIAIGDEVRVIRTGDVIPKIIGVAQEGEQREPIQVPTVCIACGSQLVKDGAHLFCRNEDCEGKLYRLLKSWVDKRNILHIGDELLTTLYESYGVREPADLYGLTEDVLAAIPRGAGVVGGNAKRIMVELNKSRTAPLNEFVGSLGIKFLGRRQAEIMIKQGVDSLRKFVLIKADELTELEGFSESKATQVVEGIKKAYPRITKLLKAGVKVTEPELVEEVAPSGDGPLAGMCFVFTGAIEKVGGDGKRFTRKMMWDVVRESGGSHEEKVKEGVTHLVQADPTKESVKTKKARKLGMKIISEADFWSLVG